MNVAFVNPPFIGRFSRTSRSPAVSKGGTLYYPIWLAYTAGVVEQDGHSIRIYDAPADGLNVNDILSDLKDFQPDIIVVDTSTPSIFHDVRVLEQIKEYFPTIFAVLVGTHPSALPEDTLRLSEKIDAVAVGEYDYTIRELVKALAENNTFENVEGLVFRNGNQIILNRKRKKIENLDALPFVSKVYIKHLNIRNYFFAAANFPMIMIMTGRGCPFKCFFCMYPQVFHSRRYITRSPENVVDEFEYIVKHFPKVQEIGIEDDCFTANKKHVKEICKLIIDRKIKIKWYCNVRGDLDYPLLKLMKDAGCRLVTVGFESGSQKILDNMHKGERVESYFQFVKDACRAGILVHGCIMVGNPGDNKETLAESYEFAKKINCDSMQFYPLYVYPGTEAYNWAIKHEYLKTQDFSLWVTKDGLHNCVLNTPELTSEDMVCLCDYYLRKYHLRPRYIARKAWQAIKNPCEGYRTIKSAKVFLSKIIMGQLGKNN